MDGSAHCTPETLSALLDGELTATERASVRAHVDSCLPCAGRVSAATSLDAGLRDAGTLPCATVLPLLSAIADGQASPPERTLAAEHLAACAGCRDWTALPIRLDVLLAGLPAARPSARVDAAIAKLGGTRAPRAAIPALPVAWRAVVATFVVAAIALGVLRLPPGSTPGQARLTPAELPLVASIQRVVLDARTNTLYVLDTDRALVTAIDATTQGPRAVIAIGGRPSALALSVPTSRVLVLDAIEKRLTEIDTTQNVVVSRSSIDIQGTPTSIQIDGAGKIVVTSVAAVAVAPAPPSAGTATRPAGQVTILNAVSKQVETITAVDVAPQLVVLESTGRRALLVSAQSTTLADAATFRAIEKLPGGVAAGFDLTGGRIAVLSTDGVGSKVTFAGEGAPAPLALTGRPLALIGMPDGAFAVLLASGGRGDVIVIDAGGRVSSSTEVALVGPNLAYDAVAGRFIVGGDPGSVVSFSTSAVAAASPTLRATASVPPSGGPASPATSAPSAPLTRPVSSPTPSGSAPVAKPGVAADARAGVPSKAELTSDGFYRISLAAGGGPISVAGTGRTLWFVDRSQRLSSVDTVTGAITQAAQLPGDGGFTRVFVSPGYVVAADTVHGRISIYGRSDGSLDTLAVAFAATATGLTSAEDGTLWIAGRDSSLVLAIDPLTKRVRAVDTGTPAITALTVDTGGRLWYGDASGTLGSYDPVKKVLSVSSVRAAGPVSGLLMDRDGTLWVGTTAGELFGVRLGARGGTRTAGGAVSGLVRDGSGVAWAYAVTPTGLAYQRLDAASAVHLVTEPVTGFAVDDQGRPWLTDPAGAFYIAIGSQ